MGISSGCSSLNRLHSGKQFALVGYLPDPLARFLDDLRLDLAPDCTPRAHVTILPPRPSRGTPQQAMKELRERASEFGPFTLRLGEIAKFPVSDVVYVEIAGGRERLSEMYRAMNAGALSFKEAYRYCPHITLAQRLSPEAAQKAFEMASLAWKACPCSRSFSVDTLHFVESEDCKCWRDLGEIVLEPHRTSHRRLAGSTRRASAEPLYRV